MTDTPKIFAIKIKEKKQIRKNSLKTSGLKQKKNRLEELQSSESESEVNLQTKLDNN